MWLQLWKKSWEDQHESSKLMMWKEESKGRWLGSPYHGGPIPPAPLCIPLAPGFLLLILEVTTLPGLWNIQFSSVTQSCPTLWEPMDYSTPGLPVHHQLLGSAQTHGHWVGGAIQPSHLWNINKGNKASGWGVILKAGIERREKNRIRARGTIFM